MPRVSGLGHLGIFVRDIERMTAFYRDFLGMQVTKQDPDGRMMFLSSDPESVDHEIALMTGRSADDGPPLIQQISLRVPSLNDLRAFHRNLKDQGYKIDQVVDSKIRPWREASYMDDEGTRLRELRRIAVDYVNLFLNGQGSPTTIEQLQRELAIHDISTLEVTLRKLIQEWIQTVPDSDLLKYDVVTVKDLVFDQLRSWC